MSRKSKLDHIDTSEYQGKKYIEFDFYGTCVHRPESFWGWEKLSTYKELRREVSRNLWKVPDKKITDTAKELFKILQTQEVNLEKPIKLSNWTEILLSKKFINKIRDDMAWVLSYKDFVWIAPELKKRWKILGVLSNLWELYSEPLINGTIPEWTFEHKTLSFKVWAMKPDPKIFEYAKESIEWADYGDIVFVGDNLKLDIEWAWNVWMKPIHIDRKYKWPPENKEINWIKYIRISTLSDLLKILN